MERETKRCRIELQSSLCDDDLFDEDLPKVGEGGFLGLLNSDGHGDDSKDDEKAARIALLISKMINVFERVNSVSDSDAKKKKSFTQVLLQDLVVNPHYDEAKKYVALGLWQKVLKCSKQALKIVEEKRSAPPSFRDVYMGKLTENFGNDIDTLRQSNHGDEIFDETVVQSLIESLESGMDVFDEVEKKVIINEMTKE